MARLAAPRAALKDTDLQNLEKCAAAIIPLDVIAGMIAGSVAVRPPSSAEAAEATRRPPTLLRPKPHNLGAPTSFPT